MDDFATLISTATIEQRVLELATDIAAGYPDQPPCAVAVMEGARMFAGRLLDALPWSVPLLEIRARSYGAGTESSGEVRLSGGEDLPVRDQRVLLIEDIVDTGRTIDRLRGHFLAAGALDVAVVTLLSKPSRRVVEVELEHVGFEIPNEFVVGYGMDLDGRYRELDRVAIYRESRVRDGG